MDLKQFQAFAAEINADGGDPGAQEVAFKALASGSGISGADLKSEMKKLVAAEMLEEEVKAIVERLGSGDQITFDDFKKAVSN